MEAQREALRLQEESLQSERASKAAEIYGKYLEVAYSRPSSKKTEEAKQFRFERDNRALLLLNALSLVSKGDAEWQEIVHWSLQRYTLLAERGDVICLSLTRDFRKRLEDMLPGEPRICRDITD